MKSSNQEVFGVSEFPHQLGVAVSWHFPLSTYASRIGTSSIIHSSPKYKLISLLSCSENSNIGQFLLMHCTLDITMSLPSLLE
jgi:hypothetical protein